MAKKASLTELMAEEMKKTTLESLASILKQEGLEKALQRRRELNDTYSENDWWPPVARAMRVLLDDYTREQEAADEREQQTNQIWAEALAKNGFSIKQLNLAFGDSFQAPFTHL